MPIAIIVALTSAFLMGLAIQRGATCMVAAVDEAVTSRGYGRFAALGEAAAWVGGILATLQLAGLAMPAYPLFPVAYGTLAGGALLGAGAWINRACVFGSIARIGAGQWAWLASPIGFFLGCLVPIVPAQAIGNAAPFAHPGILAFAFAALVGLRLYLAARSPNALAHLLQPHHATLVIAMTFVSTMFAAGAWAYTDALAALARPSLMMDPQLVLRSVMVMALLAGAIVGGRLANSLAPLRPRFSDSVRCLAGGAIMGIGAQLVPGSNDGLIMLGLPLGQTHAWIAVATMTLTIGALVQLSKASPSLRLPRSI